MGAVYKKGVVEYRREVGLKRPVGSGGKGTLHLIP